MRGRNEMRIGLGQFSELTDEKLAFIKQLGADDFLMNTPKLPGERRWEYETCWRSASAPMPRNCA